MRWVDDILGQGNMRLHSFLVNNIHPVCPDRNWHTPSRNGLSKPNGNVEDGKPPDGIWMRSCSPLKALQIRRARGEKADAFFEGKQDHLIELRASEATEGDETDPPNPRRRLNNYD